MNKFRPYLYTLLAVIIIPLIIVLSLWVFVLSQRTPLAYASLSGGVWPIACTSRGCVTSGDWLNQINTSSAFAILANSEPQTPEQALTTIIRQHIARHAVIKSPVTLADARKYRERILNLNQTELVQDALSLSAEEYDKRVVLPFLQQESLRQERKAESVDELYALLSKDRFVLLLPWHLHWNKEEARVAPK